MRRCSTVPSGKVNTVVKVNFYKEPPETALCNAEFSHSLGDSTMPNHTHQVTLYCTATTTHVRDCLLIQGTGWSIGSLLQTSTSTPRYTTVPTEATLTRQGYNTAHISLHAIGAKSSTTSVIGQNSKNRTPLRWEFAGQHSRRFRDFTPTDHPTRRASDQECWNSNNGTIVKLTKESGHKRKLSRRACAGWLGLSGVGDDVQHDFFN